MGTLEPRVLVIFQVGSETTIPSGFVYGQVRGYTLTKSITIFFYIFSHQDILLRGPIASREGVVNALKHYKGSV